MACKKPYSPPAINAPSNYLVVEGVINTSGDSTIIKLSRTVSISYGTTVNPELHAQVNVETDQNNSYPLKEIGNGKYGLPPLSSGNAGNYRLGIKTADNVEYLSDFVPPKNSPPIDSITNEFTGSAENIFAFTHDPSNNTHYYRWEYYETYLYVSPIASSAVFENGNIIPATPADQMTTCYVSDTSSSVLLYSTATLSRSIVNKMPITQVPITLDKLKIRYSILVKQYALTADAYNYYLSLNNSTVNIGTIFSTQPNSNVTNIHCLSNPNTPVVGYISAGSAAQVRIFIDRYAVPAAIVGVNYSYCDSSTAKWTGIYKPFPSLLLFGENSPLDTVTRGYDPIKKDSVFSVGYGSSACVDCRLKGSNQKPAFWQ